MRSSIAICAVLALGQVAAHAADNAVTDLHIHAELDGSHSEVVQVQDGAARKSVTWATAAARGSTEASAKAVGNGRLHASAAYAIGVGEMNATNTTSNLWAADVLTIRVPGAGPGKRTKLNFTASTRIAHNVADRSGTFGRTDFCLGDGPFGCGMTSATDWVAERLDLPAASGIESSVGFSCGSNGQVETSCKEKVVVTVIGPEAVIPIVYGIYAIAHSGYDIADDPSSVVDVTFKWTLKLPLGVTCHSRSGVAFKGLCPAAAS